MQCDGSSVVGDDKFRQKDGRRTFTECFFCLFVFCSNWYFNLALNYR